MNVQTQPVDWQAVGVTSMEVYNALPIDEREAFLSETITNMELLTTELKDFLKSEEVQAKPEDVASH